MKRTSFYKSFSDPLIGEYLIQKNSYRNLFLTVLFLVFTYLGSATNYYISNSGDDSNPGTSEAFPWRTLAKVNKSVFKPGDQILLKSGGVWRETLTISSSGNSSSYLVFGSYGTDAKPQILGSEIETGWKNKSGNIWESVDTFTDPYSLDNEGNIYFLGLNGSAVWGRIRKNDIGDCVREYDWTYANSRIYIYSSIDPNSGYLGVEITQRLNGIELNSKEFIEIDGIEIAYQSKSGINETYPTIARTGLIVKNCHIHHIGIKEGSFGVGIYANHSNTYIQNNEVHDSGRRNISIFTSGEADITISNIVIEGNVLYHGFHTTGVDVLNTSLGTRMDNITIRNNLIYDDITETIDGVESRASEGMFIANQGGVSVNNVNVNYNVIKNNTLDAIKLENLASCNVYNNTLYGVNPNKKGSGALVFISNNTNCVLKNNIFYNNVDLATNSYYPCVLVSNGDGVVTSDYNLFYSEDPSAEIVEWERNTYTTAQWNSYKSAANQDVNSPTPTNPLFVSEMDYQLTTKSVAINSGVDVKLIKDYQENPIIGRPDIGALEYGDVTDIEVFDTTEMKIYPNPATEKVTISFLNSLQLQTKIILTDISGKQLQSRQAQSDNEILNVRSYPSGIYFIKIIIGNEQSVYKLVKN